MPSQNRPNAKQLKNKMSALAERIALDSFGIRLDYSIESIQQVERILGELHKAFMKDGSEKGLQGIALEFGAYFVKVIEKNFGPIEWQRDHPSFGKDSFPLYWRDATLFPMGWCLKRGFDGEGDNVWIKFQTLVLNRIITDVK